MWVHGNCVLGSFRGTVFAAVPLLATGGSLGHSGSACHDKSVWFSQNRQTCGPYLTAILTDKAGVFARLVPLSRLDSHASSLDPPRSAFSEGALLLLLLLLFSSHRRNFKGKLPNFTAVGFVFSDLMMLWERSRSRHVRASAAKTRHVCGEDELQVLINGRKLSFFFFCPRLISEDMDMKTITAMSRSGSVGKDRCVSLSPKFKMSGVSTDANAYFVRF